MTLKSLCKSHDMKSPVQNVAGVFVLYYRIVHITFDYRIGCHECALAILLIELLVLSLRKVQIVNYITESLKNHWKHCVQNALILIDFRTQVTNPQFKFKHIAQLQILCQMKSNIPVYVPKEYKN